MMTMPVLIVASTMQQVAYALLPSTAVALCITVVVTPGIVMPLFCACHEES